ncbi:MAG: maleylpyruvate isomerase family mycothiol-dependent enzyme [Acidimicrobiales bacterium]
MADTIDMVIAERALLAEYLSELPDEQWAAATWCDRWNVQQVVGHMVAAANITAPHFAGALIKNGFSFDKVVSSDLVSYAAGSPAEVLGRFKGIISSRRKPPGPAYVALGEVMCHGEDIRRALGSAPGGHPAEHLRTVGNAYVKTGRPLRGKVRAEGLKLTATDIDWSAGEGPEVRGPAMSLILAVVGRRGVLADLEGPGMTTLGGRL